MGIGYIVGCLLSVLLWKLDRQVIYERVNNLMVKVFKKAVIVEFISVLMAILICFILSFIEIRELSNFITAFIVIDISNTERKNLKRRERVHFYDSISTISQSLICGFIAPLLYIAIGGNVLGIGYALIYNIWYSSEGSYILNCLFTVMNIVPAIIGDIILYILYASRNKTLKIEFKGDFLKNLFIRPILNIDIFAAYIESVNFYYYFDDNNTSFLKSYGHYNKKIDERCVKDYLSIVYGVSLMVFICFFVAIVKMTYK